MSSTKKIQAETAKSPPTTRGRRIWRELRGYAEALAIALFVTTFLFTTVGVIGGSMTPTLHGGTGPFLQAFFAGDRVFIPKYDTWLRRAGLVGTYERGEVVVFREPENSPMVRGRRNFYVKRLIAGPGDRVRVVEGQVYVNDHPLDQGFITASGEVRIAPDSYPEIVVEDGRITQFIGVSPEVRGPVTSPLVDFYYGSTIKALAPLPPEVIEASQARPVRFVHEIVVPEGHYFIMGDNRSRGGSVDSRYFGPIPAISVAGRATSVIWPPMRDGETNWRRLSPPPAFEAIP